MNKDILKLKIVDIKTEIYQALNEKEEPIFNGEKSVWDEEDNSPELVGPRFFIYHGLKIKKYYQGDKFKILVYDYCNNRNATTEINNKYILLLILKDIQNGNSNQTIKT